MGQSDLPLARGAAIAAAIERCGWTLNDRRGRGKHFLLTRKGNPWTISIPDHDEVKRALLAAQLRGAGISVDDFIAAFAKKHSKR